MLCENHCHRKVYRKLAALADFALYFQAGLMTIHNMVDDSQSKSGTTSRPRTSRIGSVKALS